MKRIFVLGFAASLLLAEAADARGHAVHHGGGRRHSSSGMGMMGVPGGDVDLGGGKGGKGGAGAGAGLGFVSPDSALTGGMVAPRARRKAPGYYGAPAPHRRRSPYG